MPKPKALGVLPFTSPLHGIHVVFLGFFVGWGGVLNLLLWFEKSLSSGFASFWPPPNTGVHQDSVLHALLTTHFPGDLICSQGCTNPRLSTYRPFNVRASKHSLWTASPLPQSPKSETYFPLLYLPSSSQSPKCTSHHGPTAHALASLSLHHLIWHRPLPPSPSVLKVRPAPSLWNEHLVLSTVITTLRMFPLFHPSRTTRSMNRPCNLMPLPRTPPLPTPLCLANSHLLLMAHLKGHPCEAFPSSLHQQSW